MTLKSTRNASNLRAKHLLLLAASGALMSACSSDDEDTSDAKGGTITISASGEQLGLHGYSFPATSGEIAFGDGWEVKFSKILVVISDVHLSENPDSAPADQSKYGKTVARLPGSFAVNLAASGDLVGKSGNQDRAFTLGTIQNQTENGGKAFDPSKRYAFNYSFTDASSSVTELRGLSADDADWAEMQEHGWTHYLVGTARFKGTSCEASKPDYDFESLPEEVEFRFGFEADVSMQNCQNPENTGAAFDGEEFQRGVQPANGTNTVAQITLHTDHLFWNTVNHGAVPLFNQFAAQARSVDGKYQVSLQDLEGVPLAPVTDAEGTPLPWRSCLPPGEYVLPQVPSELTFDTEGNEAIHDLYDFLIFNASTMGHMNQDGLCYVPGFEHSHDHDHDHDHDDHSGHDH